MHKLPNNAAPELTNARLEELINTHKMAIAGEVRTLADAISVCAWLLYSFCLEATKGARTSPQALFNAILKAVLAKAQNNEVRLTPTN